MRGMGKQSFSYQKFVLKYANYITAGIGTKQMFSVALTGWISFHFSSTLSKLEGQYATVHQYNSLDIYSIKQLHTLNENQPGIYRDFVSNY